MVCGLHLTLDMTKTMKLLAIQSCTSLEGPRYAVQFEDSIGHCCD